MLSDPSTPLSIVTEKSASSLSEYMESQGVLWQEDTEDCNVCRKKFVIRRRHHCRICGRCVCQGCSPNVVQLGGYDAPQRACSLCISGAERLPVLKARFGQLGDSLSVMAGLEPAGSEAKTIEDAAVLCEAALVPLEEAHGAMRDQVSALGAMLQEERRAREQAEARLAEAVRSLLDFGLSLHSVGGSPAPSMPAGTCKPADALAFCEAALTPLREARRPRRSKSLGAPPPRHCATVGGESVENSTVSNCKAAGHEGWETDATNCSHCGCRLGKRYLKPRHHCRVCGLCVCAACSPNFIQFEGQRKLQRACTPCLASAQRAPVLNKRLAALAGRLSKLSGSEGIGKSGAEPATVEQALSMCENAMITVDNVLRSSPNR